MRKGGKEVKKEKEKQISIEMSQFRLGGQKRKLDCSIWLIGQIKLIGRKYSLMATVTIINKRCFKHSISDTSFFINKRISMVVDKGIFSRIYKHT